MLQLWTWYCRGALLFSCVHISAGPLKVKSTDGQGSDKGFTL